MAINNRYTTALVGDVGMNNATAGYNGGGIMAGQPAQPSTPVQPPAGPMPTIPQGNTPPTTPVQPPQQDFSATAANPLSALPTYQPQQRQANYQAPTFQGQANYQAGNITAPQVQTPNYAAQSASAPQINVPSYQAGNTQAGQVSAQNASAGQFDVNAFRPFADAVYSEASRQLDPQFQAREAQFRQQMVNQGIQEGTSAWDAAFANFDRSRNDAYSQARNQALA